MTPFRVSSGNQPRRLIKSSYRRCAKFKPSKKANSWWKKKADTNNDGVVSEEETAAWKKLCNEKMDLNGDGKIDEKEKRKCWRHAKSKVNTKVEKQYDANG